MGNAVGNAVGALPFTGVCVKCRGMILAGTKATHVRGEGMHCLKCFPLQETTETTETTETRGLGELEFAAERELGSLFESLRTLRHQYSLGKPAASETLKAIALRKQLQATLDELDQKMAVMTPAKV
jgi:hypothetical protein